MPFSLPNLPYAFDALEPYIDTLTMEIHYTKHHQGYVNNLNKALENHPAYQNKTLEDLLMNIDILPPDLQKEVRNQGGGHYNHTLFWSIMTPKALQAPIGMVAEQLARQFGPFDTFKEKFSATAKTVFGSGWAWLCVGGHGELVITSTPNQDATIMKGLVPIMGLDVWEHAYYLQYQNRRPDYISSWWHVVNWEMIEENYKKLL